MQGEMLLRKQLPILFDQAIVPRRLQRDERLQRDKERPNEPGGKLMLDEHDASRLWQQLFRGQTITSLTLSEAEMLLEHMSPESPLRLRYATELKEIRSLYREPFSEK